MDAIVSLFAMMVSLTISLMIMAIRLTFGVIPLLFNFLGTAFGRRLLSVALVVGGLWWALRVHPVIALLVAVAAVGVWLSVRRTREPRNLEADELSELASNVGLMSGQQFEVFVASLFNSMGYKAAVLGGSGDQGVDLVLDMGGERVAVQCKNYKKAVGNKPVQEVYAGAKYHQCQHAWVVAPAGFTKGAFDLARSVGVSLFDANSIRQWFRQVDEAAKQRDKESTMDSEARDGAFEPLEPPQRVI
jgi:restriction system protein